MSGGGRSADCVDVRLFGPTQLVVDGDAVPIARRQVRRAVVALACQPGVMITADALVDRLWPDELPQHPRKALNVVLSRLRSALGRYSERLHSEGDSYRLDVDRVDVEEFARVVEECRTEPGPIAREQLSAALDMWSSTPFADEPDATWLESPRARLEELRWFAVVRRVELLIGEGEFELAATVAAPFADAEIVRERLVVAYAQALAYSGRKSSALEVLGRATRTLRESGLEPSAPLLRVERDILVGATELADSAQAPSRPSGDVFVGRSEELEIFERSGPGHSIAVVAEAGMGKSSLLDRWQSQQHADASFVRVAVRAQPERAMEALSELCLAVAPSMDICDVDERHRASLSRLCPEFGGRAAGATSRDAMVRDVVEFVEQSIGERCIIVDDAHWLDGGSAEAFEQLVHRGVVQMVFALRPTDQPYLRFLIEPAEPADGSTWVERVALTPLDASDTTALMTMLSGRSGAEDVASELALRSGGNALFLRLLVDSWIEGAGTGASLPSTVLVAVSNRLDELSRACVDTLMIASVLGTAVDLGTLRQLRPNAEANLWEAEHAGLVSIDPGLDHAEFSHALVAESCRQLLSAGRLVTLHDDVGRAAELLGRPASIAAPHFVAAAEVDPLRAIRSSLDAAAEFVSGFDWSTALRHVDDAAEVVDMFAADADDAIRAQVLIRRGTIRRAMGMADYVDDLFEGCAHARSAGADELFVVGATELCGLGATTQVGDTDDRVRALLDEALELDCAPAVRAELYASAAPLFSTTSDAGRGRQLFREAWELAFELADPAVEASIVERAHLGFSHPDDFDALVRAADRMREIGDGDDDLLWESAFIRFQTSVIVGAVDAARDAIEEMRFRAPLVKRRNRDFGMAFSESCFAAVSGDLSEAERHADATFAIGLERFDASWATTIYGMLLLQIRQEQGRLPELLDVINGMVESQPDYPPFRAIASLIAFAAGEREIARRHLDVVARSGFGDVVYDVTFTAILVVASPATAELGTDDEVRALRDLLAPFSGRYSWNGASTNGTVDSALALLETRLGNQEAADELEDAARDLVARFREASSIRS